MPKFPKRRQTLDSIGSSVFSNLASKLAEHQGEIYPFHIGDTWRQPLDSARMEALTTKEFPSLHCYGLPQGQPELREAIAVKQTANHAPCSADQVLITTGATGGLGAALGTLVDPGDEVLLCAPYWPLIRGMVQSAHGTPIDIDLLGLEKEPESFLEALTSQATDRTVGLYISTPCNPTGRVISTETLEAVAELARRHGWWILADEVYEDLQYTGEHTLMRSIAPNRTFAAHSFSKAFGMAGNRCGYVVGPREQMSQVQKVSTHAWYAAPTAAQVAAQRVLQDGTPWLTETRNLYDQLGKQTAKRLNQPAPEGSTFLFLSLEDYGIDRSLESFLMDAVGQGLFLAPGPSFGPYPGHLRLCFTATPPEVTHRGVEVLAGLLGC